MNRSTITDWLKGLQDRICIKLESLDGTAMFEEDLWNRPGGGGGRTRIIQGEHIEKGGVNFSAVEGTLPPQIAKSLGLNGAEFFATGLSIVLHPSNPHVPIIHMNVRYFETADNTWWFGGGIDLTPHYVNEAEARSFHEGLKKACDQSDPAFYPKYKKWADDYFFVRHRNETRGIGGIFYDKLTAPEVTKEEGFAFMQAVGNTFTEVYAPLFEANYKRSYTNSEKEWQKVRRGRYVEFNLVWDRGTKFGLETNGRIESILMSLPKEANWFYNHKPDPSSPEGQTQELLKKGIDWI